MKDSGHEAAIKVVVVDDHQMVLDSLVRHLDRRDISVVATAATVAEGIAAVEAHSPDIVVMDYELPDGDGASASRQITERWPRVRVILLTGSNEEAAVFEAAWGGCSGYLEKTRPPAELLGMVRSVHAGTIELPAEQLGRLPLLDELVVHYQPIVNLATSEIVGFEALVRWAHRTRGLLAPAEFLPLAEKTPFIIDIDEHVRREACGQAAEWNRLFSTNAARFMGVNLSGRDLRQMDLTARILQTIADCSLDPTALMIEVTETFLVGDAEESARRLTELSGAGVRIALDDFGTAYSSLEYLRRFPIDVIKLDKSFTDDLPFGERGLKLAKAVGRLAADMGAVAEAEGIETEEQAACLQGLGWEFGQGYYFSRPVDAHSIEALL
ncbi:MAG TPA: EAL domain-containing protein [Acidimicrobiales bacterium]|nr:EAL domain-containing protein [Acidimicrobiales bacterium]